MVGRLGRRYVGCRVGWVLYGGMLAEWKMRGVFPELCLGLFRTFGRLFLISPLKYEMKCDLFLTFGRSLTSHFTSILSNPF